MNVKKVFLSKQLYYILTALVLLVVYINLLPLALKGQETDLAQNFLSEIWGMVFTLIVFVMFMDWRERLEWKSVEDRVKRKIGIILRATFNDFLIFFRVERVHYEPHSKEKQIELVEKQLNTLISKETRFTQETKKDLLKDNIRQDFKTILDSRANRLGRIEERYSKFLGSEVTTSLMDIQEYLDKLRLEFSIPHMRNEDYFDKVRELISQIMVELQKLKKKGFWVN